MSKEKEANQLSLQPPRLPYHPALKERFGIERSGWKALTEAVFPAAQTAASVILALSYCKARKLDPFKRCVHIVPIWDSKKKRLVDTVWPGIGELRTTAFRTKGYAGRDATVFGEDETKEWQTDKGKVEITFPNSAQVTVYRIVAGERVAFAGPPVFWMEIFASTKGGCPNSMWQKRPRGQLDKCAEAAALRCAFPEEIGDDFTSDEGALIVQHGGSQETFEEAKQNVADKIKCESGSEPIDIDDESTPAETTDDDLDFMVE